MGSTKNFGEYRESLHLANPPCIPFFGVYLTDLTFIEDGIPSIIKKSTLINFAKRAKTAEVIRDIQQYQNVPYPLAPVPELQDYILSNMIAAGDVHEMYEKSLTVEPREREDEKIVRYVKFAQITEFCQYGLVPSVERLVLEYTLTCTVEFWPSLASYKSRSTNTRKLCVLDTPQATVFDERHDIHVPTKPRPARRR